MSSTLLAFALLLMEIPSLKGFVSNPRSTPLSRHPYLFSPRCTTNRYAPHYWTHQSSLSALNANTGPGDNKYEEEDDNMKSDDELFRETIDDQQYSSGGMTGDTNADDDDEEDLYMKRAPSEFIESKNSLESALARAPPVDWGGALETLSQRKSDIESGKSDNPSYAIFRTIAMERPNEAIGRFVREANPEVVASMSGAVSSLLGGLSSPAMGIETVVQTSSEKLGQLCFQLMMTGYMFRNAEYVIALKNLMNIKADATLQEYEAAFKKLDTNNSGYLEWNEVEAMLAKVYEGKTPTFEVDTFMEFFDKNNDGRISWEEFEKGFGGMKRNVPSNEYDPEAVWSNVGKALPPSDEDEEDDTINLDEPTVTGQVKVELDDGRVIEVDAQEFIDDLKQQALELKRELAIEMGEELPSDKRADANPLMGNQTNNSAGSIARYIASLQGNIQPLTQGISPEVMEAMKMLIDFVLEGPNNERGADKRDKDKNMELPGSALQQLALWQLVNGYRLRETEATGEWQRMME